LNLFYLGWEITSSISHGPRRVASNCSTADLVPVTVGYPSR
jgi:hypothetical protein